MRDLSFRYRISPYTKMYGGIVNDTFCRLMGRGTAMGLAIPGSSASCQRLFSCSGNVVCHCNVVMPIRTALVAENCRLVSAQKRRNGGIKVQISYQISRSHFCLDIAHPHQVWRKIVYPTLFASLHLFCRTLGVLTSTLSSTLST